LQEVLASLMPNEDKMPLETITVVSPDADIASAKEKYGVASYLGDNEIVSVFSYSDCTYTSKTQGLKTWKTHTIAGLQANKRYTRLKKVAKDETAAALKKFEAALNDALDKTVTQAQADDRKNEERVKSAYAQHLQQANKAMQARKEEAEQQREADYQAYCAMQQNAKTIEDLQQAASMFVKLKNYKDSDDRIDACYKKIDIQKKQEDVRTVVISVIVIMAIMAPFVAIAIFALKN
jgi:hypothetical protein